MRIEVKGLIAALSAGMIVVGAAYGLSALVVGTHALRPHPKTATTAGPGTGPSAGGAALVAEGLRFYSQSCVGCHGPNGAGGYGPRLRREDKSDAQIASTIAKGVAGKMPAFGKKYNAAQTQDLVAYIRSLK